MEQIIRLRKVGAVDGVMALGQMHCNSLVEILYSSFTIAQIETVFRHFEGGVQKAEYQKGTSMHQRVVGTARQPADIILVVFAKTGNCSLVLSDLAKNNNLANNNYFVYSHENELLETSPRRTSQEQGAGTT